MERPAEELKALSDEAARHISAGGGAHAARILRMLHGTQALSSAPESADRSRGTDRVGIWKRTTIDGEDVFVRDTEAAHEWNLWANIGRIPPKHAARRVVLLGESVARGYFYDPAYNPATVLTAILEFQLGADAVEIVDLARISIEMEIRELAIAAGALQPDAVVLFCGNNWSYTHPTDPLGAGRLGAVIGERGVAGLKDHAESVLRQRAERVVDDVSAFYAAAGVPVLWILPEFNLGGWRDPVANAAHLPGDRNDQWLTHQAAARAALGAGDRDGAVKAALQMIEADQGTSAAGYYLLAECGVGADGTGDVRAALEAARDASGWDTTVQLTPRASATVGDVLRDRARTGCARLVDSAELFRDHLDGEIPGRRMFLDYCHLTSEGIRVTMAAAASVVLDAFGAEAATWRRLLPRAPRPTAEAESEAHFLAAVHSAHWWQDGATVGHFISESLRFSRHLVPLMTAFVEQQARRVPPMLSRSAEAILASGSLQIQQYLFGHEHQCLDPLLCAAIVDGLRGIGAEPEFRLDRLWREEHSPERGPVDLLEYYYLSAARQPHEVEWVRFESVSRERDYFKAFSPVSRFCLVGDTRHPVVFDLTWRIPHAATAEESVLVRVNERPIGALRGGTAWSHHTFTVPEGVLRDGLNEIALEWPSPSPSPAPRRFGAGDQAKYEDRGVGPFVDWTRPYVR